MRAGKAWVRTSRVRKSGASSDLLLSELVGEAWIYSLKQQRLWIPDVDRSRHFVRE